MSAYGSSGQVGHERPHRPHRRAGVSSVPGWVARWTTSLTTAAAFVIIGGDAGVGKTTVVGGVRRRSVRSAG